MKVNDINKPYNGNYIKNKRYFHVENDNGIPTRPLI